MACNAASSALDLDIEEFGGDNFHSILPSGIRSVEASLASKIGLIGGERTISSGFYRKRLSHLNREFCYFAAQPLSAFVERGELEGEAVETYLVDLLLKMGNVEGLLLTCTHHPALAKKWGKCQTSILF